MILGYDPYDPFLQPPEREVPRAELKRRLSNRHPPVLVPAGMEYRSAVDGNGQMRGWLIDKRGAKAQVERERATRFGAQGADYGAPMLAASAMLFTAVSPGPLQLAIAAVVALLQWRYWLYRVRQRADAIAPEGA